MESKNTYWNRTGKYQKRIDQLKELMPGTGYTNNIYINLFLAASHLYNDIHNNGGCNIKDLYWDDIQEHIAPFSNEIKTIRFNVTLNTIYRNLKNEDKLERFMNEVISFLDNQDLSFTKYSVYANHSENKLSKEPREDFKEVSFGDVEDYNSWITIFINRNHYEMVE